jgi:hypothetical protein
MPKTTPPQMACYGCDKDEVQLRCCMKFEEYNARGIKVGETDSNKAKFVSRGN